MVNGPIQFTSKILANITALTKHTFLQNQSSGKHCSLHSQLYTRFPKHLLKPDVYLLSPSVMSWTNYFRIPAYSSLYSSHCRPWSKTITASCFLDISISLKSHSFRLAHTHTHTHRQTHTHTKTDMHTHAQPAIAVLYVHLYMLSSCASMVHPFTYQTTQYSIIYWMPTNCIQKGFTFIVDAAQSSPNLSATRMWIQKRHWGHKKKSPIMLPFTQNIHYLTYNLMWCVWRSPPILSPGVVCDMSFATSYVQIPWLQKLQCSTIPMSRCTRHRQHNYAVQFTVEICH